MIQAWLTSVMGIVAAGVLLDIILPEGDTAKYAKGVYALIVVLVLASPVTELVKSLKEVRSSETLAADGSFLDALEYRREQADEALVEKALAEIGLDGCKVNIFAAADGGYTPERVNVDVSGCENFRREDEQRAVETVKLKLGCKEVRIYGQRE